MVKRFSDGYRAVFAVLCILVFLFAVLSVFFYLDDRYREQMSQELSFMTECGGDSGHTACISAASAGDIVFRTGDTGSNRLAITCNVDWGEEVLPDILDVLDEYNVKITFFVTGHWAEKNPKLLRTMYLKGHEIQSHGYSHKLCSQVSDKEVEEEIDRTSDAVFRIIGVRPDIFAPPSGDFDESTVEICRKKGYLLSLWSADTIDWRQDSTADVIYNRIMKKDLHGAILLMHPKEETLKALPRLLDAFQEQNLSPVTLSTLIRNQE